MLVSLSFHKLRRFVAGRPRRTQCPWPEKVLCHRGPTQMFRGGCDQTRNVRTFERGRFREIRDQVRNTITFGRERFETPWLPEGWFASGSDDAGFEPEWPSELRLTVNVERQQRGVTVTLPSWYRQEIKRLPTCRKAVRCPAIKECKSFYQRVFPAFKLPKVSNSADDFPGVFEMRQSIPDERKKTDFENKREYFSLSSPCICSVSFLNSPFQRYYWIEF